MLDKFQNSKFAQKLLTWSQKLSQEVHLRAIRDAFLFTIPFLVLSGFMTFIAYVAFAEGSWLATNLPATVVQPITTISAYAINGGNNIYAMMTCFLISYNLAKSKGFKTPILAAAVTLGALFIFMPTAITTEQIGLHGMFVGLLTGLLVTELFLRLSKIKKLQIHISGAVPPAIIESFNSMIVIIIVHLICAIISWACVYFGGMEIHQLINALIQAPMVGVSTNLGAFLLYFGVGQDLSYFLGIHPAGIINPIFEPGLLVAIEENTAAWQAGLPIPHIISLPFRDVYGTLGGISNTLGLTIAILLFVKRRDMRDVAKMAVATEVFNINEPILFGLPIVYNPIMLIPFCFTTTIIYVLAYAATVIGLISPLVVYTAWSTPIFLSGYVASGGDWRNVIFQVFCLAISVLTYLPFAKLMERQQVDSGEEEEEIVFTSEDALLD